MTASNDQRRGRGPGRTIAWVVLAVGVCVSSVAALGWRQVTLDRSAARADEAVSTTAAAAQAGLQRDLDLVASARAFVSLTAAAASAPQLQAWFDSMDAERQFPDAQGIGYIERVPAERLAAVAADTFGAAVDPTGDVATQLQIQPPGARPFYCMARAGVEGSIQFAVPVTAVDFCAGRLLYADGTQDDVRAAFAEAERTGDVVIRASAINPGRSVAVVLPVSTDPSVALGTPGPQLRGWVTAGIDLDPVIERSLPGGTAAWARLERIADDGAFTVAEGAAGQLGGSTVTHRVPLEAFGAWELEIRVEPAVTTAVANAQAAGVAAIGLVITALAFALVWVLSTSKERAWALVEQATAELAHQALHDPLTGLPNRSLVLDRAEHLLERTRRTASTPAALFVDLDGFKDVNDTFGHPIGDALLVQVGARLAGVLRQADSIGRLGGDEFVVLLEVDPESPRAERVADRLLHSLAEPFELDELPGHPLVIGASVGVAVGSRATAAELLRDADVALYEAKSSGRGRYVVFRPEMLTPVEERLRRDHERADPTEPGADPTGTPVGGR